MSVLVALLAAGAAEAAHPVFDLVANRSLAHGIQHGGLYIAAGPGFPRYTHFGRPNTWRGRAVEEGHKVWLASTASILEVPLTAEQAKATTLWVRLKASGKQSVKISGAGKSSASVGVDVGWHTVAIPLPADMLVTGENKLLLGFAQTGTFGAQKASAAVEWIAVGGSAAPADGGLKLAQSDGLSLGKETGLAYYVEVPAGGALSLSGQDGGCALHVRALAGHKALVDANITVGAPLSLAAAAGKIVRLELLADGASCTATKLEAQLLADGDGVGAAKYDKRPRNVIVWLTDSTRADKYRVINPKTRVETSVMDAFAKKATVFATAYVQGNESRVSHASLFTSLYPAQHKFIAEKAKLNPAFVTMPEALKALGLHTVGIMANGFIDAFWGFGEGWDVLKNHIHDGGGLKAEDLVKVAKTFLEKEHAKPFFTYLGTIDAHVSWRAHAPWIQKYDPEPYSGPYVKALLDPTLDQIVAGKIKMTDRDKVRVLALYDSDVSYNDQQFGELLKTLESLGRMEDTMIVLTADHGEEMYDHGRIGHGQSLHEELVHVPLMVYYPPLFPAGKKVEEGVESIDILPTLVDALGGKPPADAQGQSLVGLAQGVGAGYPRPAIASQYELAHTMRLGRWKLWVGGSGDVKLFDLVTDPGGLKELGQEHATERRFVADALGLWMAYQGKWKKSRWGVASNQTAAFAADLD